MGQIPAGRHASGPTHSQAQHPAAHCTTANPTDPRHYADGGESQQQARQYVGQVVPPARKQRQPGTAGQWLALKSGGIAVSTPIQSPSKHPNTYKQAAISAALQDPPPPLPPAHPMAARLSASASAHAVTPAHSQGRLLARNTAANSATKDALRQWEKRGDGGRPRQPRQPGSGWISSTAADTDSICWRVCLPFPPLPRICSCSLAAHPPAAVARGEGEVVHRNNDGEV